MDALEDNMEDKTGGVGTARARGTRKFNRQITELSNLFNITDKQEFVENVSALTGITSRTIDKSKFSDWSDAVKDKNPIHLDEEAAKNFSLANFLTTPTYGTMILAHAEQYLSRFLNEINLRLDNPLTYTGERVKFGAPLYPGESLRWVLSRVSGKRDEPNLTITGLGDKDKEVVNINGLKLRQQRLEVDDKERTKMLSNFTFFQDFDITDEDLGKYYSCLEYPREAVVPLTFATALSIASLLQLCRKRTGKYDGLYRASEAEFYRAHLTLGRYRTLISHLNVKGDDKKGFVYQLGVLVNNAKNNETVFRGKINCSSTLKLD